MTKQTDTEDWFKTAFSRDYIRIYRHRNQDEARENLLKLLTHLSLPANARCLDLCCGFGRHVAVLNELGLDTIGIDLSLDLLREAPREVQGRLFQADMRVLPFDTESFDFVFSFFTSFGYFRDDEENFRVIAEIARVLRPDAGVLIDFLNPAYVRQHLVPEDTQEFPGFTVRQRRWLDPVNNSIDKEVTVIEAQGERCWRESVKLYGLSEFQGFFQRAGLRLVRCLGDPAGESFTEDSARMIMIGEKA